MIGGCDETEHANAEALRRLLDAAPMLVDLRPASEVISQLGERELLHAGPPLADWSEACGALHGAVAGTLVHLRQAHNIVEAEEMAAAGAFKLRSASDFNAMATFAGVITRDTPVFVVENRTAATKAYAAVNEGRGKALRYGSNDADTLARLAWLEGQFAAILSAAIGVSGGIDLFNLLGQALHMGDDGHSRQKAASALFLNAIAAPMLEVSHFSVREKAQALRFIATNDIFFLPLTMAAAKSTMVAAEGVAGSTLTTCMAANGVRFGVKISGLKGVWHTAPVPIIKGQYFSGFGPDDAGPVIGDSEIAETMGLGAFAMAAAPALARYVGGTPDEAVRLSQEMYRITLTEHPRFTIPAASYRGTPLGIDARRVAEIGVEPLFNTGIAHREPGVGQIGAGYGRAPQSCFVAALTMLGIQKKTGGDRKAR